ncbi:MAG: ATP-binding protein [Ignavibacteria bacterium]
MTDNLLPEITETEIQNRIFELFRIAIFVIVDGEIITANRCACEVINSKNLNFLSGRKVEEFFDKIDFDKVQQILEWDSGEPKEVELKVLYGGKENSKKFWAFLARYDNKKAIVLIGTDDTLTKSSWFLQHLISLSKIWEIFKALPHPIFLLDKNGNIQQYISGTTRISELFSGELTGRNLFDVLADETLEKLRKTFELSLETNKFYKIECEFSYSNQLFSVYGIIIPVEDENVILILIDKTPITETERKLESISILYATVISIALDLINSEPSEFDSRLNSALSLMGKTTGVDRVYVFDYDFNRDIMINTYEWCAPGIEPQIENLQEVPNSLLPEWVQSHLAKKNIVIPKVNDLPEEDNLRKILEPQDIKSLITVPIFAHNELIGFVGYDSVKRYKVFDSKEIELLEVFAELLGAISFRNKIYIELEKKAEELKQRETAMLSIVEDLEEEIERRKQIEKALEISERNYKDIFTSVSEAIFILDIETGRILDVNNAAVSMYKYENKEEILAVEFSALRANIEPYTEENFRELITQALKGETQTSEWLGKKKDGELFWAELTIKKVFLVDRDVILIVKRDITDRKKIELLLSLQYNIADMMVKAKSLDEFLKGIRNELSKVMDTTNFFIARYDQSKDTLQQIIWVDERDEFNEWKAENSLSGIVVKSNKSLLLCKSDIKEIKKSHSAQLLGSDPECWLGVPIVVEGKVFGAMVVQSYTNRDAYDEHSKEILQTIANQIGVYIERMIMEESLIRAKEKAEESDRLKTAFLQNISHEIRTPLNGIIGFAQLLYEGEVTKEEIPEYAEIILTSANRLLDLINNIIDISKIQSGILEVVYSSVNLNETINKVIRQFSLLVKGKQLNLKTRYSFPDENSIIYSDGLFIHQIISNLLSNAIKFTDKGEIEISYILQGDKLLFSVRDTGCGIDPEKGGKIFERFYQADVSLSRRYEGSGLGLAITKGLVEALGGKVWFESTPNQGTTFYFTIPYYLSRPDLEKSEIKVEEKISGKREKILVVEDERINYLYMSRILELGNFEVIPAFTGNEAIEIVRNNNDIKLVLMDIKLPDLNGIEVTKAIKQIKPDIPIIAQSAYAFTNEREKMMEAGCDDYISKPFLKQDFLKLIKKFLS